MVANLRGDGKMTKGKKVPKRLKKYRMDSGYTIYSLADRLNVHFTTVSYWENGGKFPRQGKLMELEDLFGAGHRELFSDLTEKEANDLEKRRQNPEEANKK